MFSPSEFFSSNSKCGLAFRIKKENMVFLWFCAKRKTIRTPYKFFYFDLLVLIGKEYLKSSSILQESHDVFRPIPELAVARYPDPAALS